jgi:predicted phosphodiesterase
LTKIAIISDLHLNHWSRVYHQTHPIDTIKASLDLEKPDLIIDAGDYEQDVDFGIPMYKIPGNHDYYGKEWEGFDSICESKNYFGYNDLKFVMATFWGDFNKNDPYARIMYKRCLNDCSCIRDFTPEDAYKCHEEHVGFIRLCKAITDVDVVVTHNAPSFCSVHEKYKKLGLEYDINYGFASELDDFVEEIKPKIWIHGHVHTSFDYMIGNTRVICNPCAYPSERGSNLYVPVYVEL